MSKPLISVVVVTLNAEKTLQDTINSLQSQTFKEFEVIFKDGGSQDSTIDIIKSCNLNYKISVEPDNGIYDAMNKGSVLSNGKFITFLNADDQLESNNVLEKLSNLIIKGNADLYYGSIKIISNRDKHNIQRVWESRNFNKLSFLSGYVPPHPGSLIRKEIFRELNGFDDSFKLAGDFDFFLRCLKNKIIICPVNFDTVLMADGGASSGFGDVLKVKYKELLYSFKKNNFRLYGYSHIASRVIFRLKAMLRNKYRKYEKL